MSYEKHKERHYVFTRKNSHKVNFSPYNGLAVLALEFETEFKTICIQSLCKINLLFKTNRETMLKINKEIENKQSCTQTRSKSHLQSILH